MADEEQRDDPHLNARELELFERLFEERFLSIKYFFVRQHCSDEDSRDLAQEVFIAAYKGLKNFRFESEPTTWLLRIAQNKLLNHVRNQRAAKRIEPDILTSLSESPFEPPDPNGRTPESELFSRESITRTWAAIDSLPPKMKQCLELRIKGLEYHEIAGIMGLSIETIKSHLHQARSRMRAKVTTSPAESAV